MRRRIAYGLLALLALLLLAAGGGAAWLAGTAGGARWLLAAVSRHTPLAVSAGRIEGRLLDRLRLEEVSLALATAPVSLRIESLELRWRPLLLLTGRAAIQELALTGVAIRDDGPAGTPPDLSWPRVTGLAGLFSARIERLAVNRLTFHRLAEPPVRVDRLSVALAWRNGVFTLENLLAETAAGRLTGGIAVGLERPSLQLDLEAVPAAPLASLEAFSLQARVFPGGGGRAGGGGLYRPMGVTGRAAAPAGGQARWRPSSRP